MAVTTREQTQETGQIVLPGGDAIRAWEEAASLRQSLRNQFLEATKDLARTKAEVDRLATAALETEGRVLLGDAVQAELDRINSAAETAATRIRSFEKTISTLKPQIEMVEKKLPALRKGWEVARGQAIAAARVMHENAVKRIAAIGRELAACNAAEGRIRMALHELIGSSGGLRPLGLLDRHLGREDDSNSGLAMWLRELRYPDAGYDV